MKPGSSSLNPYAASYIPLSKRVADNQTSVTKTDSKGHGAIGWFQTPKNIRGDQHLLDTHSQAADNVPVAENLPTAEAFHLKSQPASSSYVSSSQNVGEMTDMHMLDEEADMDLEYLRMTFPGISYQSLLDVYIVNGNDLEAAIDMLTQLEFDGAVSSGSLPETLDIGDVSESGSSADSASLKLKNVAAEASTSSSPLASVNVS